MLRPPGSAIVVQQGVLVVLIGDYESDLRFFMRAQEEQSLGSILDSLRGGGGQPDPALNAPEPRIPSMMLAGYAMFQSRFFEPKIDLWAAKLVENRPMMGGSPLYFLRFSLPRSIPIMVALPMIVWIAWRLRVRYAAHRERLGFCAECGYDIRTASAPRCPECGAAFGIHARRAFDYGTAVTGDLQAPAPLECHDDGTSS